MFHVKQKIIMIDKECNLKIMFYWLIDVFIMLAIINPAISIIKYEIFNNSERLNGKHLK